MRSHHHPHHHPDFFAPRAGGPADDPSDNQDEGPRGRRRRGPGPGGRPGRGDDERTGPGPAGFDGPGFGGPGSRGRGRRGGPFGRPGGWQQADLPPADDAPEWLAGRLPGDWFTGAPTVSVDREEIVVVGELPRVDAPARAGVDPAGAAAAAGRISRWREETREQRIAIAQEAQARYGRTLSWGARIGEHEQLFTHLAVPVMTRLRQPQRQVLDTLVDAGIARSRSDALAWSVALVGQHIEPWLAELRAKMAEVDKLRAEGPQL